MKSKKNKIIVFANQKGGVGKSTLCILLADYLAYWKKDVCIIDTDLQQSATLPLGPWDACQSKNVSKTDRPLEKKNRTASSRLRSATPRRCRC